MVVVPSGAVVVAKESARDTGTSAKHAAERVKHPQRDASAGDRLAVRALDFHGSRAWIGKHQPMGSLEEGLRCEGSPRTITKKVNSVGASSPQLWYDQTELALTVRRGVHLDGIAVEIRDRRRVEDNPDVGHGLALAVNDFAGKGPSCGRLREQNCYQDRAEGDCHSRSL